MIRELQKVLRGEKIAVGVVKRTCGKVVVEVKGEELEASCTYKCQVGDRALVDVHSCQVVRVLYRSKTRSIS